MSHHRSDLPNEAPSVLREDAATLDLTAVLAHFTEHGYARLGRVIASPFLDALRARADEIMLGRVVYPGMFFQHDSETGRREDLKLKLGYVGPSLEYRKIEKLERDDLYRALLSNRLFERVTRALIGADVTIYRAVLFNKGRSGGSPIPWHQDGGAFWGLDRDPSLQVWTAIDDATRESGCVEVIPGSHREGLATPLGGMIPDPVVAARRDVSKAVALEARAGEVLLLHNYLWHRSGRNASGAPRRALTVCYLDAATRCRRKKHAPRQFVRVFSKASSPPDTDARTETPGQRR